MKLGIISSEDLQDHILKRHENSYQFRRFAGSYSEKA
jgi:hypothetical protein